MASFEAQLNIRNNVRDMQACVQDLYDWEKEIKSKDDAYTHVKSPRRSNRESVPVRGKAAAVQAGAPELMRPSPALAQGAARTKIKPKASQQKHSEHAAGHTYEHSKDRWDKFDVDAALAEVDRESDHETIEPLTDVERPQQAAIRQCRTPEEDSEFWRTKGNEYFKFGDYTKANECYTSSLQAVETAAAFANRGLTYLKLKEWDLAATDCTHALRIDPRQLKALQRRATAHKELNAISACLADLDTALRLVPTSQAVSSELRSVLQEYAGTIGLQIPDTLVPVTTRIVEPLTTSDAPAEVAGVLLPSRNTQNEEGREPAEPSSNAMLSEPLHDSCEAEPVLENELQHVSEQPVSVPSTSPDQPLKQDTNKSRPPSSTGSAVSSNGGIRIPSTSAAFEACWRGCKGGIAQQGAYLGAIPSSRLPAIFKSSLTPHVLAGVAESALLEFVCSPCAANAQTGIEILEAMTRVDRFGMNTMLLNAKHKAALWDAWSKASTALGDSPHKDNLLKLQKLYRM